jgi:WD40 repeat protein
MTRSVALVGLLALVADGWAADPPTKKASAEPPVVRSLSFSPDGTRLAAAAMPKDRGGLVVVWDVATRKLVSKYDRAGESPTAVFSPDGKVLAVANGRAILTLVDPATGQKAGELGPFPSELTGVAPAGAGKWVALGKDGVIRLWDEKEKKVAREFGGLKRVYSWAVSPKGEWLFAGGEGGDKLWNLSTGAEAVELNKGRPGTASRGVFMTDDRLLVGTNMGTQKVFEVPSGKERLRFKNEGGTEGTVYSAAAGMMASRYYTDMRASLTPLAVRPPTDDEKARVSALLKECDSDDYASREKAAAALVEVGAAIEPLLRQAMTDGPSAEVRMRARVVREGLLNKPKFRLTGHADEVRPMTFSPDGKVFATGGADGLVILWDPATGKELARLTVAGE